MGVGNDGDEMGFRHGDKHGGGISCPSSGLEMTSMPLYAKADPFFFPTDWDPIVSTMVSNNRFSSYHCPSLVMENQGMNGFSHYPSVSVSSYIEMAPKLLSYGTTSSQVSRSCIPPNKEVGSEEAGVASPNTERRKSETESNPSLNWNKKAVVEHEKDASEQNLKETENEQNAGLNPHGKQSAKENTDTENLQSGDCPQENYVLVRARKGQATNSHSLAERVRREKISERMKLLQELVPGCNRITGKAVMLDEIINYVQSLQQQVEFLSMKLATVNPELNFDIQQIQSKDILHSRCSAAPITGFDSSMNPSHPFGIDQGAMPSIPTANPQFSPFPQTTLDDELQGLYQMGFAYSSAVDSFTPNGRLKPEL